MAAGEQSANAEAVLVRVVDLLLRAGSAQQGLQRIVEEAVRDVPAAVSAGITVVRGDGVIESSANIGDLAAVVDRAQASIGEGPCLVAAQPGAVLRVDDFSAERRWPRFAGQARRLGAASMLTCVLFPGPGMVAASLSLHGVEPWVFDHDAVRTAAAYTVPASVALRQAAEVASLQQALRSRQFIGEATGVLMERHRLDAQAAFNLLIEASQRLNVKLRDVAEYVARSGQDPTLLRAGDVTR